MLKTFAALALVLCFVTVANAEDKPYKEGPVTDVSFIRVKDGKLLDYIAHLRGSYKQEMDAFKKAGLIVDYRIYQATPHRPDDPNIILTVTYPNYAAFDRTADFDAISVKVQGSLKAAATAFAARASVRDVLGSEQMQELILK